MKKSIYLFIQSFNYIKTIKQKLHYNLKKNKNVIIKKYLEFYLILLILITELILYKIMLNQNFPKQQKIIIFLKNLSSTAEKFAKDLYTEKPHFPKNLIFYYLVKIKIIKLKISLKK